MKEKNEKLTEEIQKLKEEIFFGENKRLELENRINKFVFYNIYFYIFD